MTMRVLHSEWVDYMLAIGCGTFIVEGPGTAGILSADYTTKAGVRKRGVRAPKNVTAGHMAAGHLLACLSSKKGDPTRGDLQVYPVANQVWRGNRSAATVLAEMTIIAGRKINAHEGDAIGLARYFAVTHKGLRDSLVMELERREDRRLARRKTCATSRSNASRQK
jgi:hypothetical protein